MSPSASAQENVKIVEKLWDALQHPGPTSLQTMVGLMDENIDWEVVPLGLKRHGIGEMRQLIEGSWADYPKDGWHEITNIFATEDWVCLEYTARGTINKELKHLGIAHEAKGQKMEVPGIDVFRIKNGKIVCAREYYDNATLMRQLGAGQSANSENAIEQR